MVKYWTSFKIEHRDLIILEGELNKEKLKSLIKF